jgi:hypothetical protein
MILCVYCAFLSLKLWVPFCGYLRGRDCFAALIAHPFRLNSVENSPLVVFLEIDGHAVQV